MLRANPDTHVWWGASATPSAPARSRPDAEKSSTRAGSGRVADVASRRVPGTVLADNLPPQKARVLLTVALTKTDDPVELQRIFDQY